MNVEILLKKTLPMDIFFVSGANYKIWNLLNRATGASPKLAFSREIPTHCGFVTHDHGQVLCTELTEDGIEEDSMEKYLRGPRGDRLLYIYRWREFTHPDIMEHALCSLASQRQQDRGYDWRGAIGLAIPWIKQRNSKEYCSENVFSYLRRYGWEKYPKEWNKRAPHPWPLAQAIHADRSFKKAVCVKW